jgi:hypothetical protein
MVATENIYAMPASDRLFPLTQANGTIFQAKRWGDERLNGKETEDGYSIVFDDVTQNWMYAIHDFEGWLVASSNTVGKDSPPVGIKPFLRPVVAQVANNNPTFRNNNTLTIPFVDLPEKGGAYQNVKFELTEKGEWKLLTFIKGYEIQHINKVEVIKTNSFPVQVLLKITGHFMYNCQEVGEFISRLLVNKFDVWMYKKRTDRGGCGFEQTPFTHIIPLPVYSLRKGKYEYSVNGSHTGTFDLDEDNKL